MVRRILLQLDSDQHASSFDAIAACDAGVDHVLSYNGVTPADVPNLVHGAIFTRGLDDLHHTAIFVGGRDVRMGEEILAACRQTFFGRFRVSAMMDSNGANTTAAALVAKVTGAADVRGRRVVVLAAGAVGLRAAALLAREGAEVVITSRSAERAHAAVAFLKQRFGVTITGAEVKDQHGTATVLEGAVAAITAGAPGITLLPRTIWAGHPTLAVLADVNAVPPLGVEGLEAADNGVERWGKRCFGALGIGGLKMKVHRAAVAALFTANDQILDVEEIYTFTCNMA